MPGITSRLRDYLEENHVAFEPIHHRRDVTAQRTAEDTHTPGMAYAKTVVLEVDGRLAMAVLPAHHHVDLDRMRRSLKAGTVTLANEATMRRACPDCEVGAEPPFGNLYDLPVYVSSAMADDETITFKAGTHEDVIRMAYADFAALVKPTALEFSS